MVPADNDRRRHASSRSRSAAGAVRAEVVPEPFYKRPGKSVGTNKDCCMYPTDLEYTKDHEWVRIEGGEAAVGITDFAQRQLGDVVFVELPEVGRQVKQGEVFGTIESVKAVSELFSPVVGRSRRRQRRPRAAIPRRSMPSRTRPG